MRALKGPRKQTSRYSVLSAAHRLLVDAALSRPPSIMTKAIMLVPHCPAGSFWTFSAPPHLQAMRNRTSVLLPVQRTNKMHRRQRQLLCTATVLTRGSRWCLHAYVGLLYESLFELSCRLLLSIFDSTCHPVEPKGNRPASLAVLMASCQVSL